MRFVLLSMMVSSGAFAGMNVGLFYGGTVMVIGLQ